MSKENHAYAVGYELFTPDVGEKDHMICPCCQDFMDVKRNVQRTARYSGKVIPNEFCDVFTCKNAGEKWHDQIIALLQEIKNTPSSFLAKVFKAEVTAIRKNKTASKEVGEY